MVEIKLENNNIVVSLTAFMADKYSPKAMTCRNFEDDQYSYKVSVTVDKVEKKEKQTQKIMKKKMMNSDI